MTASLPLASLNARTYQRLFCSEGGRKGTFAGLERAGFRALPESRRLDLTASVVVPCHVTSDAMLNIDRRINGSRLVATLVGQMNPMCIGGSKAVQLVCRRELARKHGCKFEDLGIQPPQFKLDDEADCQALAAHARADQAWLLKPSSGQKGAGIRYYKSTKAVIAATGDGNCGESTLNQRRGMLAQIYVVPALLGGFKFDVRAWMLVASTRPLLLFSNQGVVRVAGMPYDSDDSSRLVHVTNAEGQEGTGSHIRWWQHVDDNLKAAGGPFMQTRFRKQAERAMRFAALAQFQRSSGGDGGGTTAHLGNAHYQVFGCDFIIDSALDAHLLECNGNPTERGPPVMWEEMVALLLALHFEPARLVDADARSAARPPPPKGTVWSDGPAVKPALASLSPGYQFGSWTLFYNGLVTPVDTYDACHDFG